jgi:hypothetical protein
MIQTGGHKRPVLLVVDDDPTVLMLLRTVLSRRGFAVWAALRELGFNLTRSVGPAIGGIVLGQSPDLLWPAAAAVCRSSASLGSSTTSASGTASIAASNSPVDGFMKRPPSTQTAPRLSNSSKAGRTSVKTRAFATISSYSPDADESWVMPPPTPYSAVRVRVSRTTVRIAMQVSNASPGIA